MDNVGLLKVSSVTSISEVFCNKNPLDFGQAKIKGWIRMGQVKLVEGSL